MTVRDVLVQIGFLMVTSGAMLAAWAILTGQFSRSEPENLPAEPVQEMAEEPEFVIPSIQRRAAQPRAGREKAKPAKPRTVARSPKAKPRTRKPPSRKPRPSE